VAADTRQVQGGYTPGTTEVHRPYVGLGVPVLQISCPAGPITGVRIASAGQNSPLAVIIDARDGKVFVKGLPSGHRRVITQAREAAVAPLVKEISPALLWHFDEAGWNVLGYQYAPGRHEVAGADPPQA
jgi:hypothetical protein